MRRNPSDHAVSGGYNPLIVGNNEEGCERSTRLYGAVRSDESGMRAQVKEVAHNYRVFIESKPDDHGASLLICDSPAQQAAAVSDEIALELSDRVPGRKPRRAVLILLLLLRRQRVEAIHNCFDRVVVPVQHNGGVVLAALLEDAVRDAVVGLDSSIGEPNLGLGIDDNVVL